MKTTKLATMLSFLLLITVLSTACGAISSRQRFNTRSGRTPFLKIPTVLPTSDSLVPTLDWLPVPTIQFSTSTPGGYPTPTKPQTATQTASVNTPTPGPTRTPLPFQALHGLRTASVINGNLYVQDGGENALQLTKSGQDREPVFSDDGQKIAFVRGEGREQLWTINVDGTGEQVIITLEKIGRFGDQYHERTGIDSLAFIPGTYDLVFNTGIGYGLGGEGHTVSNKDLWFVESETGEIRQLREPDQGGNFLISPDGKKIGVQTLDHVDVIDSQGKLLLRDLVAREFPIDDYYGISWAEMFWTPDSRELIILPSIVSPGTGGVPMVRRVWRYSMDGQGKGEEIKLNPPAFEYAFSISPDGNWIAYTYTWGISELVTWLPGFVTDDLEKPTGVYLGNLHDGTSQLLYSPMLNPRTGFADVPLTYYSWSPDSVFFIVEDYGTQLFIGNVHGDFDSIGISRYIGVAGWIDNNHYLTVDGVLHELGTQEAFQVDYYFDSFIYLKP